MLKRYFRSAVPCVSWGTPCRQKSSESLSITGAGNWERTRRRKERKKEKSLSDFPSFSLYTTYDTKKTKRGAILVSIHQHHFKRFSFQSEHFSPPAFSLFPAAVTILLVVPLHSVGWREPHANVLFNGSNNWSWVGRRRQPKEKGIFGGKRPISRYTHTCEMNVTIWPYANKLQRLGEKRGEK